MSNDWKFKQLQSPYKEIVLSDYAVPFGRPRQKPLLKDKLTVRNQVTRYPGNNGPPTRHLFGVHREDYDLSGRWMDSKLGTGFTATLIRNWEQFIADQVPMRMTWGNILSYVGIVESIEVDWESDSQVAWTLHLLIDEKDGYTFQSRTQQTLTVDRTAELISRIDLMTDNLKQMATSVPDLPVTFLDRIDNALALMAEPSAALTKLVNQLESLENLASGDLQRFRLAFSQITNSVVGIENIIIYAAVDTAAWVRQSDSDIKFYDVTAKHNLYAAEMLEILADLQRDTQLVQQRGPSVRSFTARMFDSWESISNAVYGDPSGAAKIRAANGIRFGMLPQAGTKYKIPV